VPAYNSSNGNESVYIGEYPLLPSELALERHTARAGILRRWFGMPKLELTLQAKSEANEPRLRVEVEASPEEIAIATTVGQRVLGRLRGFLRLRGR
jgi:hypothetical protein